MASKTKTGLIDRRRDQGFSLLEVCVALLIMTISALGAAGLFFFATKYNSNSYDANVALVIAQQRLERLRRASFDDTSLAAGSATDTFNNAGRLYTVVTTICNTSDCGGSATLELITVQVSPAGSSNLWVATVTGQRASPASGPYLQ
jgi:prepilin-type N-terminal cleavage/methylation domain-containing protein